MAKSDEALFVESAIVPDGEVREDLAQRLGDRRAYSLMGAALTLAVQRKFPEGSSTEDIRTFVSDMSARFPDAADNFDAGATEAVIRGVRSEHQLLDDVDPDYLADMSFLVTYAIMSHENLQGEQLDQFLNDVIALVDGE